jgi:hypothetical protein
MEPRNRFEGINSVHVALFVVPEDGGINALESITGQTFTNSGLTSYMDNSGYSTWVMDGMVFYYTCDYRK